MLVLSRKHGEEIRIGRDITLKIVQLEGNRVRIGIEAPAEVRIVRLKDAYMAHTATDSVSPTTDDVPLVPHETV